MGIQSFREHCRSLDESFDKPYPWTTSRVSFTDFHATFVAIATPTPQDKNSLSTGKAPINRYSVDFVKRTDQRVFVDGEDTHPWEFTFELTQGEDNPAKWSAEAHPQYGITQTGHAFTVFATVIAVMKAFIAHHHPGIIYFSAHERSRAKLYDRFITQVGVSVSGYVGHKLTKAMRSRGGSRPPRLTSAPDWIDDGNYVIARQSIPLKTILSTTDYDA